MSKKFNPNDLSVPNGNYFALPYSPQESRIVLLSVPWDVTTSYGGGASLAPDAIIDASAQIDLHDYHCGNIYEQGISTLPIEENILETSDLLRKDAQKVISMLSEGAEPSHDSITRRTTKINNASEDINNYVYKSTKEWLKKGKTIGLVGGDHSTPLGLFKAMAEHHREIGILHIDAHADLRDAYEGFKYSHASIMYNTINEISGVIKLVQVGVRDYCEDEKNIINSSERIETFYDMQLEERKMEGESWGDICREIISHLPDKVHISFDIDGLAPYHCPSTGTPVPGGLTFNEAMFLINETVKSGRTIVGFDLTEVVPDDNNEWDANVGARVLYKLCNYALM